MDPVIEKVIETPEATQAAIDLANGNVEPTATGEGADDLWGDIAQELDTTDSEDEFTDDVSEVVKAKATPVAPEVPASVEPATPTAEVKIPAAEIPAVVATPQPVVPVAPVAVPVIPQVPTQTPEEQRAAQQQLRATAIESLASQYSLSDEAATQFLTDPGAVVPKFRAELFLDVFDATMGALLKAIPTLMEQTNTTKKAQSESEDAFYAANPLLNKGEHAETVNRFAHAYLQAVPNATAEQLMRDVGVQVMYSVGIDPTKVAAPAAVAPVVPVATPYTPAGAGTQASGIPKADTNIWGAIAESMDEDEE